MKRTRKWTFVAQEAGRLADLGLQTGEIAKRLGVNTSTVRRWRSAGKLPKKAAKASSHAQVAATAGQSPAEWAKSVREAYQLDTTDEQLVTLAEQALERARNPATGAGVQLTAMRTFQGLVRQLALVARAEPEAPPAPAEEPKKAPARAVRRPGADPRKLLMMPVAK